MKNRFVVVLRLGRMSVVQKREKALFIVQSMKSNPYFLNPIPTLADIIAAVNELKEAAIAAEEGRKKDTVVMHLKEAKLVRLLVSEGHYVEDIANADPENGKEIILSAGMDFKKVHIRKASAFKAVNTKMNGQVKLRSRYIKHASYIWQYSTEPDSNASWITAGVTIKASVIISNLSSGTRYSFRYAVVDKNGQGAWSERVSLMVM